MFNAYTHTNFRHREVLCTTTRTRKKSNSFVYYSASQNYFWYCVSRWLKQCDSDIIRILLRALTATETASF